MRVLVVGPRKDLCSALAAEGIPFVVWASEKSRFPSAEAVHTAPIAVGRERALREAEELASRGPFSHVIAGTETAVMAASVARRVLGTRLSPHTTVLRCHDKLHMKQHLVQRGIPMTDFLAPGEADDAAAVVRRLGLPVVVKPRTMSGGREIESVRDAGALRMDALRKRLLERMVDAPEVSVESFVNGGRILFENVTEYARKTFVNVVPAGIDDAVRESVLALNREVISALAIQWGMTHLEVFVTPEGPLFGEIALRPPGGRIMDLISMAYDFDAWRAFVAVEADLEFAFPAAPRRHAAAMILHPGSGTVTRVEGLREVRRMAEVTVAKVHVRPGDGVSPRAGVADSVGYVLMQAATRPALLEAFRRVEDALRIEVE